MAGWITPPPNEPIKTREELERERAAKVEELASSGLLKSERIRQALLKIAREDFIPRLYRDHAYLEVPLPLPGQQATISCPHSYPLFYEPLGLDAGHRFLEVGLGSGYGTAVAREVVGDEGLVVAVEIDPLTFEFAKANLERAGYDDVVLVNADGGLGHPPLQPYDRISITAACRSIPPPLTEQLAPGGKLIAPILDDGRQFLILVEKTVQGMTTKDICEVLYVSLRGKYGA
ncbi:MAG: protein-L-isoaspartate O-methyltransferase [Gemmatimonadota bacterium]|nr:MAG: protein-L-isoaspartate O-methyltransferase [Gemmatimonadota bacterium]